MLEDEQDQAWAVFEVTRRRPEFRGKFAFQVDESLWSPEYREFRRANTGRLARLQSIVAEHGWPGRSVVGEEGAKAAWSILQHADHDNAARLALLPLVGEAFAAGEVDGEQLATLYDRAAVQEGRPQRYGTVLGVAGGGWTITGELDDPGGLDRRRAELGLPPWADWTGNLPPPSVWYGD